MGLESLIANDVFYYGVYILSFTLIGLTGCMFVHIIDKKTEDWCVYQLEGEGKKHYEKRLREFVY